MTSIVLSRDLVTGSPGALVLPAAPGGTYFISEDITVPELDHKTTFADDSPHVGGALVTQSVLAVGSLGFTVYTEADDAATLKAQMSALKAALSQFTYTATLNLIGTDVYTALPARLSWGTIDSGLVKRLLVPGVVTIPVQPLEA